MKAANPSSPWIVLMALVGMLLTGCSEDARLVEIARESARSQAEQNKEMARVHREVAEGTKRLVEADAEARREILEAHSGLQNQQAEIGRQRDVLESERQTIAGQRLTESKLGPILKSCLVGVLAVATVLFCLMLLLGLRSDDAADQALNELLVEELVSPSPGPLRIGCAPDAEEHPLLPPHDRTEPPRLQKD